MRAPGLSIIIPHLNQPHFLARCLASLGPQIQARHDVEVIVVDNGSHILPQDVCTAWPGVRLATEAKTGPGPARNTGIALSHYNILAFIDADCVAAPGWISAILDSFARDGGHQVIGGDVQILYERPGDLTRLEAYESVFAYRQQDYIEKQGFSGTGNLAMRAEIFERVGPFAGITLAEDRDWGQRAGRSGVRIVYCPGMVVFHPARKTFAELRLKWDRHMEHDLNATGRTAGARLYQAGRALAVAVSGLVDIRKIVVSQRISGVRARAGASLVLIRIRLYRARKMMVLALSPPEHPGPAWNQQ